MGEAARLDYKMLREQMERKVHQQDFEKYELAITQAVAEGDTAGLRAALKQGADALGRGHPLMQKGQSELSRLTKSEGHNKRERIEKKHCAVIADAIEAGETEALKAAVKAAAKTLGPNHPEVEHARLLARAWRDSDNESQHRFTV